MWGIPSHCALVADGDDELGVHVLHLWDGHALVPHRVRGAGLFVVAGIL